jgi:hypothetical protein
MQAWLLSTSLEEKEISDHPSVTTIGLGPAVIYGKRRLSGRREEEVRRGPHTPDQVKATGWKDGADVARESGGVVIMWVQHPLGPIDFRIMDSDFGVVVVSVDRKNYSWHAVVVFENFLLRFWIE